MKFNIKSVFLITNIQLSTSLKRLKMNSKLVLLFLIIAITAVFAAPSGEKALPDEQCYTYYNDAAKVKFNKISCDIQIK